MARKTKQIQKEEKNDAPAPAATKKGGKKANEANWDIFSEGFKDRLSQFVDLNEEVLQLKGSVEGTDQTDQINERKERMAKKVEEAAAAILKDELGSLEQWIKDQQKNLKDGIAKIEEAYENSRNTLLSTGAFGEDEIKNQLANVQKKAEEKRQVYENYEGLLARSKEIYS